MSGPIALVAGAGSAQLARAIACRLDVVLTPTATQRFPDGELGVRVGPVRDADVYVIQTTAPECHDRLVELALLADAARRSGAARVTGVVPYLAYARQDRRDADGTSLGGRVIARMLSSALDRVIALDLHDRALEGFFDCPVEHLSAIPTFAEHLNVSEGTVVVSPDLGGIKRATRLARLLGLDVALVRKRRVSATEVEVLGVDGDVRSKDALIVDDMISTGATIVAAVDALRRAGACRVGAVATHALLVGDAAARLAALDLEPFAVSDSVAIGPHPSLRTMFIGIAPLLGDALARIHSSAPLAELLATD